MTDQTAPKPVSSRPRSFWLAVAGVAGLILVALAGLIWGGSRPLKPIRPQATAVAVTLNSQPILVTFPELNERPYDFQNQRLRVSGSLTRFTLPSCIPYSGPVFRWGLITDELQMNASGFETLMRLVPVGTNITVEGIWRLYTGPLGCGKGPETDNVWFLQVEQIIQPNPFPPTTPMTVQAGTPMLTATPTFIPSPTPGSAATATLPVTITDTAVTSTATGTLEPGTPTVSGTLTATTTTPTPTGGTPGTAVPTATAATPSATPTLAPGQPTFTPFPTPGPGTVTATATLDPGFITATPGPTSTPGGYPDPPTPGPTATSGSYP